MNRPIRLSTTLCLLLLLASPLFGANITPREPSSFRLMCYNVRNCKGMDDSIDYHRLSAVINATLPDVVALQELDSATMRSGGVVVIDQLARQTLMYPLFAKAIDYGGGAYGIGILSKEKPISHYSIPLPGSEEPRVLLVAEFQQYILANCHLSLVEADRDKAMQIINATLTRTDKPIFLVGDMNSSPSSNAQAILSSRFDYLSDTTQHTCPSTTPTSTIDYICGLKNDDRYTLIGRSVIHEPMASDHRPLFIDLRFKAPARLIMRTLPYLQNPTEGGMTVSWLTHVPTHSWVEYGTQPDRLDQKAQRMVDGQVICNNTHQKIRLANLKPQTTYYYRTASREITLYQAYRKEFGHTAYSDTYSFTTPPKEKGDFTAWIFNDLHKQKPVLEALVNQLKESNPDMIFFNGDCIDDPKDEQSAVDFLSHMAQTVEATRRPIFITRGNHEIRNAYSIALRELIDYVDNRTYNAFSWGDTRFVTLDCGEDKPDSTPVYYQLNDFTALRNSQVDFLNNELKSKPFKKATKRVLLHHIPIYNNKNVSYGPCRDLWHPLLKKAPFNVSINAHTHRHYHLKKGEAENNFPVVVGGDNTLKSATVMLLEKRGNTLRLKVINTKGEIVLDTEL